MTGESEAHSHGRLAGEKSDSYKRALVQVEGRANRLLAKYMLASDLAYVLVASDLGFTPRPIARELVGALLTLLETTPGGRDEAPVGDIVVERERWVERQVGNTGAAWLHLGRNRGESLRGYLPRLFFQHTLFEAEQAVLRMLAVIIDRSGPLLDALAPNYHHLQHAGLTTVGEYLLSWATTFLPHVERLQQVRARLDYAPPTITARPDLIALYERVSRRLGFTRQAQLRRESIWTQDQFSEPFFVLTLISADLARLAQDLRIWMTPEFDLFQLADEHAAGSSALPHAKVPFSLQAVIGGAGMAAGRLAGELAASANPSEGSEPLYHSASLYQLALDIVAWVQFMADVLDKGHFNLAEMERKARIGFAGTGEAHDKLVFEYGVPFRTGHHILGSVVRALSMGQPVPDVSQLIESEARLKVAVDQREIVDIITTAVIPVTTFSVEAIGKYRAQIQNLVESSAELASVGNPIDHMLDRLQADARGWLSKG